MKKINVLFFFMLLIVTLLGYSTYKTTNEIEKYTMFASVSLGSPDESSLDKTKVTYTVIIEGNKEDIENIHAQEPLINMEYLDCMLENGPHHAEIKNEENPYFEVSGSFVFDTPNKTKEEISNMDLFEGIKIIDKENNEYLLKFNHTKRE